MKILTVFLLIHFYVPTTSAAGPTRLIDQAPHAASSRLNPLQGGERDLSAGAKLFARECSACHGKVGEGYDNAPPLRSRVIAEAPAGILFWVLRNGSRRRGMPSFAHLPEPQRWQIVTYLKAMQNKTIREP